jgi:hypothetical protein
MNIGDILHTRAEREAAPIGAVIQIINGSPVDRWTKTGSNLWTSDGPGPNRTDARGGWFEDYDVDGYRVEVWPGISVGDVLHTSAQRAACPVGTVVRHGNNGTEWTKTAPDLWTAGRGNTRPDSGERGWEPDDYTGGQGYTVQSVPITGPVIEGVVADYSALCALPDGAVFFAESQPEVRWVVGDGVRAVREGDTVGVAVALSVFEGPANAGALRTGEPVPVVTPAHLGVGEVVTSRAQYAALPVGTVLYSRTGVERTKVGVDQWSRPDRSNSTSARMRLNFFTVHSLPVIEAGVVLPAVGTTVQTMEQMVALPVGTILSTRSGRWTRREDGRWHQEGSSNEGTDDGSMSVPDYNTVEFLPVVFEVGQRLHTQAEFDALPVGTALRHYDLPNNEGYRWVKQESGIWQHENGATYVPWQLPVFAVHSLPIDPATQPTEPVVTVAEAEAERNRAIRDAVGRAVAVRDEEFLSALREHWDGVNFQPSEINNVLEDLGLEGIETTECITVSVTVTGRTNLDRHDVENLFEGDLSASLTDTLSAEWTIEDIEFDDIEVRSGQCGCDEVDSDMVRDRLDANSVIYSEYDWTASCSNH